MRALILSDSHGRSDLVVRAYEEACAQGGADAVLFAGDGWDDLMPLVERKIPVYAVRGNSENLVGGPPYMRVETLEQARVMITHGHRSDVRHTLDELVKSARDMSAIVAVYGHTHAQHAKWHRGVLTVNPGALRDGRYAVLQVQTGHIEAELKQIKNISAGEGRS
jgi:putative phosphoesterase